MKPDELAARAVEVSEVLRTLANPNRLQLVCTLVEGERSVGSLEKELGIHQPILSQQLTVLRRAGIVATRRQSKQVFYRLSESKVAELVAALYQIFCQEMEGEEAS